MNVDYYVVIVVVIVVVLVIVVIDNGRNVINFYGNDNGDNDDTTDIRTRNARSAGRGAYPEIRVCCRGRRGGSGAARDRKSFDFN